jgi:MFS family permease
MTAPLPAQGLSSPNLPGTAASALSAAAEWRANWPLVLTSAIGMSLLSITAYSMGLFFQPLEREFGWSRGEVSFGLTIYSIVAVLLGPLVGALIDRWGARRVAIPSVIMFGIMFASLSLTGSSVMTWWALWLGVALTGLGIKPTVWVTAISSRFVTSRGLAIALTLCGTAISSSLSPLVSRWLIDVVGWRLAYVYMGLGWSALLLVLILPFFFDSRDRFRLARKSAGQAPHATPILPGLTFREAIRDPAFQKLAVASLLVSMSILGTVIHLVPILTMRGLSREAAAGVLSIFGIASALGKLGTGWLFDRMDARAIASVCLALPAVPLLMLALTPEGQVVPLGVAVGSVALLGFAGGAELSVTAYLTTRYVGLRAFAQNYAIISSIMAIASGVAPLLAGLIYDWTGGYVAFLFAGIPAAILAGLFISTLGPFPVWQKEGSRAPAA